MAIVRSIAICLSKWLFLVSKLFSAATTYMTCTLALMILAMPVTMRILVQNKKMQSCYCSDRSRTRVTSPSLLLPLFRAFITYMTKHSQ